MAAPVPLAEHASVLASADLPRVKFASAKGVLKGEDVTLVQPEVPWPTVSAPAAPEPSAACFAIPADLSEGPDGRISGEQASSHGTFGAYCVFDGHNGPHAAQWCREEFLQLLLGQLPLGPMPASPELPNAEGWRESVQKALAVTFHQMQHSFASTGLLAGTTATCVLQTGWVITVANVGDSMGMLDTGYDVLDITTDHRIADSMQEQDRVTQLGGVITNLDRSGHGPSSDPINGLGPLRIWPGGVANARAIGDFDVQGYLLPCPAIRQLMVPKQGGRVIIASDGVWDVFDIKRVAKLSRSYPTVAAADRVLATVVRAQGGLRDDTSLVVIDLLPPDVYSFPEALGRKKGSGGTATQRLRELSAARAATKSGGWCCASKPAVIEMDASIHSDPSVHPDISIRSRPVARLLADVDVAVVCGLMPSKLQDDGGMTVLWRDTVLVEALVETQKDALKVFNQSFNQRKVGMVPSKSMGGSQSLLAYFGRATVTEQQADDAALPAVHAQSLSTAGTAGGQAGPPRKLSRVNTARMQLTQVPGAIAVDSALLPSHEPLDSGSIMEEQRVAGRLPLTPLQQQTIALTEPAVQGANPPADAHPRSTPASRNPDIDSARLTTLDRTRGSLGGKQAAASTAADPHRPRQITIHRGSPHAPLDGPASAAMQRMRAARHASRKDAQGVAGAGIEGESPRSTGSADSGHSMLMVDDSAHGATELMLKGASGPASDLANTLVHGAQE